MSDHWREIAIAVVGIVGYAVREFFKERRYVRHRKWAEEDRHRLAEDLKKRDEKLDAKVEENTDLTRQVVQKIEDMPK